MNLVDRGSGAPVVLVPGIQGRWEWMAPAVDALAARCRVITFSLADEPSADMPGSGLPGEPHGMDAYVDQVRLALDTLHIERAVICGVSFGGVVAAAFNQRHPTRVSGLAFVSALPPSWRPDDRVRAYLRWPRLLLPLFLVGSFHLYREISVAAGGGFAAVRAAARQAWQALRHFPAPARMAARAGFVAQAQVDAQGSRHVPVLIVTGEARLERVVPPRLTAEYATIWPQARSVTLERTGHLGLVTRPAAFADVLVPFVEGCERAAEETRRRVG